MGFTGRLTVVLAVALAAACGGESEGDGGGDDCAVGEVYNAISGTCEVSVGDAGSGDVVAEDAMSSDVEETDAGEVDAGAGDAAGGEDVQQQDVQQEDVQQEDVGDEDVSQPSAGVLVGVVKRQASASPEEDGVGNLYIAMFDKDPISNRESAQLVGFQLIEDADLADASNEVAYRIEGITPRADEYYVTAFLDDDGTADTSNPEQAGPDGGDLVAVDSFFPPSSPKVTVDAATEVSFDVVLNFNMI